MRPRNQRARAAKRERQFFAGQPANNRRGRGRPTFLAGRGMSMQPEGFHHALSEHQGLTFFDAVNRFRGERPVVGMDPGFYRREEEGPPGPFERPTRGSTLLSGRVRRQKLDENAVALERETARMAATQTRYTTPAPTRRTGFNARRRSSLAGNETMLGGRTVLG